MGSLIAFALPLPLLSVQNGFRIATLPYLVAGTRWVGVSYGVPPLPASQFTVCTSPCAASRSRMVAGFGVWILAGIS